MPWLKLIELSWRNNQNDISCIPEGVYICQPYNSPTKGDVYLLGNTGSRKMIEMHPANFASELLGCLAPGMDFGKLNGQIAVLDSVKALNLIKTKTNYQPFQLTITKGTL